MNAVRIIQGEQSRVQVVRSENAIVRTVLAADTKVQVVFSGPPGRAGQDGGGLSAGPGMQIVGAELRYNISALTRG